MMRSILKTYLLALLAFLILDGLWLGIIMKDFNLRELATIGRIVDGEFQLSILPAALAYLLMAAAMTFFVAPRLTATMARQRRFAWGALMGLVIYGVYDGTNLAVLKDYPLRFAAVDMAWGSFQFGLVALLVKPRQS
jgi:uncharacterized membrane protein